MLDGLGGSVSIDNGEFDSDVGVDVSLVSQNVAVAILNSFYVVLFLC